MLQNVDPNVITWVLIALAIIVGLFFAGSVTIVAQFLRTRREDLERAFQSADPKVQQITLGAVTQLSTLVGTLTNLVALGKDVTDKNPNTPLEPMYTGDYTADAINHIEFFSQSPHRTLTETELTRLEAATAALQENILAMKGGQVAPSG